MKRVYITTFLTCIAVLALVFGVSQSMNLNRSMDSVTVGFLYESDESAPYSYNFARSQTALKEDLKDSVTILTKHNVPDDAIEDMVREFAVKGCSIIFTNCHSEVFAQLAPLFPDVQICQISDMKEVPADYPDNYHTFNGEIYQARYVSGIAAGLKPSKEAEPYISGYTGDMVCTACGDVKYGKAIPALAGTDPDVLRVNSVTLYDRSGNPLDHYNGNGLSLIVLNCAATNSTTSTLKVMITSYDSDGRFVSCEYRTVKRSDFGTDLTIPYSCDSGVGRVVLMVVDESYLAANPLIPLTD